MTYSDDRKGSQKTAARRSRILDMIGTHCHTLSMEVRFTPEQEAQLARIASFEGVAPAQLVLGAVLRLIEETENRVGLEDAAKNPAPKVCPECGHRFLGSGWDGIDAHWRSKHEDIMLYESAWKLIRAGSYDREHVEDIEDINIAEMRLRELQTGHSTTHSLDDVERELGLAN